MTLVGSSAVTGTPWRVAVFVVTLLAGAGLSAQSPAPSLAGETTTANTPDSEEGALEEPAGGSAGRWRFRDFFTSKKRLREKWLEDGEFDRLSRDTGSADWAAIKRYRDGDYQGAAESFGSAGDETKTGAGAGVDGRESQSSLYNEATSLAQTGDYDKALERFDRLLADNPEHADAVHNRAIVEQLKDLQEEQENASGDSSDEQQQESDKDEQQQENQDSEGKTDPSAQDQDDRQSSSGKQGEGSEKADASSENDSASSSDEAGSEATGASPDLEQMKQAGASDGSQEDLEQQRQQALGELANEEPLSEQQQATEQWLRQIPDDPSGLLRRKLQRSHRLEYPQVTNSKQPW